jgi:hypothetical protein
MAEGGRMTGAELSPACWRASTAVAAAFREMFTVDGHAHASASARRSPACGRANQNSGRAARGRRGETPSPSTASPTRTGRSPARFTHSTRVNCEIGRRAEVMDPPQTPPRPPASPGRYSSNRATSCSWAAATEDVPLVVETRNDGPGAPTGPAPRQRPSQGLTTAPDRSPHRRSLTVSARRFTVDHAHSSGGGSCGMRVCPSGSAKMPLVQRGRSSRDPAVAT